MESSHSPLVDVVALHETLSRTRAHLHRLQKARAHKFQSLGVGQATVLATMKKDKYLVTRMNALALKECLRDRLRQRKFEMERLERNYRRTMNGMSFITLVTYPCLIRCRY